MSAALTLAKPEHLDHLLALVRAFHTEMSIDATDTMRRDGLMPLLEGSPHGATYLIGPPRAAIGYVIVTFGWSVEFGGLDGFIDEIFIRPAVRGRGLATEVLHTLPKALSEAGVKALHLEVDRTDDATQRLYAKSGFQLRDRFALMSRKL